jgi:hypothetical protein
MLKRRKPMKDLAGKTAFVTGRLDLITAEVVLAQIGAV